MVCGVWGNWRLLIRWPAVLIFLVALTVWAFSRLGVGLGVSRSSWGGGFGLCDCCICSNGWFHKEAPIDFL